MFKRERFFNDKAILRQLKILLFYLFKKSNKLGLFLLNKCYILNFLLMIARFKKTNIQYYSNRIWIFRIPLGQPLG